MKNNKLTAILLIAFALTISLSACKKTDNDDDEKVPPDNASISGTLAGQINHDELDMSDKASCTFDRFPWTVAKFKELQAQVATEPQGAVTMVLIAMEIYRKYPVTGEECLYLATTVNEHDPNNPGHMSKDRIMYRLDELLRRTNDSYARPYQVAAYLKGANQQNGYIPEKPYTVEVEAMNFPYEYNSTLDAKFIQYYVLTGGKDSGKDIIRVIKPWNSAYFLVDNFPGLYSQVKELPGSMTWDNNMFIK
jgi:D-methionine transport system substrate-binding protein